MELDESINFVDSEAVNAYGSVVAKEEHKNPCEHFEEGENVDPPCFHPFVNFFLNWSLPSLLNKTNGQGSVEVSCPWRGACVRKGGRGHCPCKAGNKNCNANCQCHWHSWNEVTKLKIIKHPAVQYFSIFLFKIQKILIRKCSSFIYNPQVLPGSLQFRT